MKQIFFVVALLATSMPAWAQDITVTNATAVEGGNMLFVLTLNKTVSGGCSVQVSFSSGSADGSDFNTAAQEISFTGTTVGERQSLLVATIDDDVAEGNETFTVNFSTEQIDLSLPSPATGTITDNDRATLSIDNAAGNEGDRLVFTVTLDKAVSQKFVAVVSLQDGTASAPGDYANGIHRLLFDGEAGESQSFTMSTKVDTDPNEGDEFFTVGLAVDPSMNHVDASATARGVISDFTDCRYCPSPVFLDSVEQFTITFYGDGNLQQTVQSGEDLAASTGVGVYVKKYFRNSYKQKFGLWYMAELMAQINVASSVDTLTAEQDSAQTVVRNVSTFGNSMLTPLNSGQAVDLRLRLYNLKTYGGFLSGVELHYIGSNRNWKLNADTVAQINTNMARVLLFHDVVPIANRDSYSVMIKAGYAANWIRGDLGSHVNDELRKKYIGTDRRTFHGIELGLGFKLKNILADFAYTIFPETNGVEGLSGSRLVTTIKFVGGFNIKID